MVHVLLVHTGFQACLQTIRPILENYFTITTPLSKDKDESHPASVLQAEYKDLSVELSLQ